MNKLFCLLTIIPFFVLGCTANVIEESKVSKEINNLNLNIFSKNGDKKYSIKSPYSTYNNFINKFQLQKTTINIFQDEFLTIPDEVLKESNVIKNILDPMNELSANLDEENKLVFSTEIIKKSNVYSWINLSYLIKEFLSSLNKSIDNFEIERPLTNKVFSNYIGEKADKYISSLTLDELQDIACLSDFLDIKYLLETVCAFIAYKFVRNKTIEEIKELDLI